MHATALRVGALLAVLSLSCRAQRAVRARVRTGGGAPARNGTAEAPPAPAPPSGSDRTLSSDRRSGSSARARRLRRARSLAAMPVLRRALGEGAIVENFMVNTPICCPSRTEFFTGRYFHNVGPPSVQGGCMHADTTRAGSNRTGIFGLMKRAGYNVGVFGKVTNDQTRILQQMGDESAADFIDAPVDYNDYDGMRYWQYWDANRSTHMERLSETDPIFGTPYQTTQIGNRTLRWLDSAIDAATATGAASGAKRVPFFPTSACTRRTFRPSRRPGTSTRSTMWSRPALPTTMLPRSERHDTCAKTHRWTTAWLAGRTSTSGQVEQLALGRRSHSRRHDKLEARGVLTHVHPVLVRPWVQTSQWRIGTSKQHPYETDIRTRSSCAARHPGGETRPRSRATLTSLHDAASSRGEGVSPGSDLDGRSMASFMVAGMAPEEGAAARPGGTISERVPQRGHVLQ